MRFGYISSLTKRGHLVGHQQAFAELKKYPVDVAVEVVANGRAAVAECGGSVVRLNVGSLYEARLVVTVIVVAGPVPDGSVQPSDLLIYLALAGNSEVGWHVDRVYLGS